MLVTLATLLSTLGYTVLGDCWMIGIYVLALGLVGDIDPEKMPKLYRWLGPFARPALTLYLLFGIVIRRSPVLLAKLLHELEREVYEGGHEEAYRLAYAALVDRVREELTQAQDQDKSAT